MYSSSLWSTRVVHTCDGMMHPHGGRTAVVHSVRWSSEQKLSPNHGTGRRPKPMYLLRTEPCHAMPCHSRITDMYVRCCVGTSRSIVDGAKKQQQHKAGALSCLVPGNTRWRRDSHMLACSLAHSRGASRFSLIFLLLLLVSFPAGLPAGRSPGPGHGRLWGYNWAIGLAGEGD